MNATKALSHLSHNLPGYVFLPRVACLVTCACLQYWLVAFFNSVVNQNNHMNYEMQDAASIAVAMHTVGWASPCLFATTACGDGKPHKCHMHIIISWAWKVFTLFLVSSPAHMHHWVWGQDYLLPCTHVYWGTIRIRLKAYRQACFFFSENKSPLFLFCIQSQLLYQ